MKISRGLIYCILLIMSLHLGTSQPVLAIGSLDNLIDERSSISLPGTIASETACSGIFKEEEIPDDGSWLQVCLLDPLAPDQGTVTEVNIKYILDHPDPSQLEVRLSHEGSETSLALWDGKESYAGAELGKAVGLDAFNRTPSKGGWILWCAI